MSQEKKHTYIASETDTVPRTSELPVEEVPTSRPVTDWEEIPSYRPAKKSDQTSWPVRAPSYLISATQKKWLVVLLGIICILLVLATVIFAVARNTLYGGSDSDRTPSTEEATGADGHNIIPVGGVAGTGDRPYADGVEGKVQIPFAEVTTIISADAISSGHAVLADISGGISSAEIVASRYAEEKIYPASMTKVMTLIVVVENLPDANDLSRILTIDKATYDSMTAQGSSGIGLATGARLSVEDLLYLLILESDGMATVELAEYIAGSETAFAELMNKKATAMGLTGTHFTNATGLHDDNHYSTCRDIATIMAYAMDMSLCRRVLTTKERNVACTTESGYSFTYYAQSGLLKKHFEKYSPNQPNSLTVTGGKTGLTDEAGYCLVTYAEDSQGKRYVCVTAEAKSYGACISDYVTIYNGYAD